MSNFEITSYGDSPHPRMQFPLALAMPLANSTPTEMSTTIIINNLNYNKVIINEESSKSSHKSAKKKVVVPKKAITAKKSSSNAIKPAGHNNKKKMSSVQRILDQINMTKYAQLFKNYDMDRFKELRELDLNAMGITRPQELRTLKEAIQRAKVEN